jgi:hypothetical protein
MMDGWQVAIFGEAIPIVWDFTYVRAQTSA